MAAVRDENIAEKDTVTLKRMARSLNIKPESGKSSARPLRLKLKTDIQRF